MIDMNHKYQTRDGRAVRILAIDEAATSLPYSVIGRVMSKWGKEDLLSWMADGRECSFDTSPLDLIPVPTKHEGWVVYLDMPYSFSSREGAENWMRHDNRTNEKTVIAHVTWEDE